MISSFEGFIFCDTCLEIFSCNDFETVFLTASREYLYLSSSLVKEIALNEGELGIFVPKIVEEELRKKVKEIKHNR